MGNLTALLFVLASFLLVMLSPTLRRDKTLMAAAWLTLILHHAAALMNAFVTPLSTSWGDLYRFHNIGAGLYHEAGQPYGELLGVLYHFGGVSFWLGEEASIQTFALALVLFVEIGVRLGARNKMLECILLFGCLPSPVIHTSVTLREPYQALGFLGCCFALLLIREGKHLAGGMLLALSTGILFLMHQGLIIFILGIFAFGVPWALRSYGQQTAVLGLVVVCLLPLGLPKLLSSMESDSPTARAMQEGNFVEYAANYRNLVDAARSDYGVKISTQGPLDFILTTGVVLVMYFVAPLPWQVSSPMDIYAISEVVLRLFLLYGCVRRLQRESGELRQKLLCVFLLAMGLEMMWAVATTNWGTALRHHVVVYGAFVLLGMPYYATFSLDPTATALERRRARRRKNHPSVVDFATNSRVVDLYTIRAFFQSQARSLTLITLLASAVIIGLNRPKSLPQGLSTMISYVSSGSLLLSTAGRNEVMGVKASSGSSELEMWLAEPDLFRTLLERVQFHEKIAKKLKATHPQLAKFAHSVTVLPIYSLDADARISGRDKMVEGDYARVDSQVARASYLRKATRLKIHGSARSPEDSRMLTETAVQVLQETLVDVATRRILNQKRAIQGYISLNLRRIAKGEASLRALPGVQPELLEKLEKQELTLTREISRISGLCADLRSQIDLQQKNSTFRHLVGESPLRDRVTAAEKERILAETIYMPDSLAQEMSNRHVAGVLKLGRELENARMEEALVLLQSNLRAEEAQMRELHHDLNSLKKRRPSLKDQNTFKERSKELEGWQAELLSWEKKLLQARLEETLCRNEGVSTVLQTPMAGTRSSAPIQKFLEPYQRMLSLLPMAPLLALCCVLCRYLLLETRQIAVRAEHYLDAPLLMELPRAETSRERRQAKGVFGGGRKPRDG